MAILLLHEGQVIPSSGIDLGNNASHNTAGDPFKTLAISWGNTMLELKEVHGYLQSNIYHRMGRELIM